MPLKEGMDESVPVEDFEHLDNLKGYIPDNVIEELARESDQSSALPPSSTAPGDDQGSPGPEESPGAVDDIVAPDEFDRRHRNAFEGLLYLGALTAEFSLAGHQFKIRTLTVGELLEVSLIQEKYLNNMGNSRAFVTAMVAGCIVSIDGQRLPQPLTMNPADTALGNAFSYIRDSWYPWIVDGVYEKLLILEGRVNEILGAMGEASPSAQ